MTKRDIYIPLLYEMGIDVKRLKEVCAGLEEEGVPYQLLPSEKSMNFIELGESAASMSPLEVGIGVGLLEEICIHQAKLKQPYFIDDLTNGRNIGKNAARLVKGVPLQLG